MFNPNPSDATEFARPTPAGRLLFALLMLFLLVGLLTLDPLWAKFDAYTKTLDRCGQLRALQGMLATYAALPLLMIFFMARNALRILKYGQVPPPGTFLLWKMKVKRGRRARTEGWMGLLFAFAFLVLLCLACVLAWPLFSAAFGQWDFCAARA